MSRTLHGKNRKNGNFALNYYAMETLNYLGNGLKKKYGVYAPMSKEDCKILARILRNKGNLLYILKDDNSHSLQNAFNFRMNSMRANQEWDYMTDTNTIDWVLKLADWFDNCGGLVVPRDEVGDID